MGGRKSRGWRSDPRGWEKDDVASKESNWLYEDFRIRGRSLSPLPLTAHALLEPHQCLLLLGGELVFDPDYE